MSKIIIKLSIFGIALYFIAIIIFAWLGRDISDELFRLPLELVLYFAANDNKKYNCRYARFLALSIFGTDSFTYIDSIFNIVPDVYLFLCILSLMWVASISATIILGISHFRKVRKLKKEKKSYEYKFK